MAAPRVLATSLSNVGRPVTKDPAYRNGWEDGRIGPKRLFLENPNLSGWEGHEERLAYYRGHRDGRRAREMLAEG